MRECVGKIYSVDDYVMHVIFLYVVMLDCVSRDTVEQAAVYHVVYAC